ncbi:MAG: transporter associated domain-containing protein [Eubacteriales bacterium]|nr:transporter associated domain-containing protein [Eubacteriales bacterium]
MYKTQAKILRVMTRATRILEYALCVMVVIGVVLSFPDLFKYLVNIVFHTRDASYTLFSEFLRHTLLLVAGIELIVMLITHSNQALLTLILFVIARKMLVYADGMTDILVGSIAMAIIFSVLKFLLDDEKMLASYDRIYSAAIPLNKLRIEHNITLPKEEEVHTLGGLIYHLSKAKGDELTENSSFEAGDYTLTVISMVDGVIKQVRIDRHEQYSK